MCVDSGHMRRWHAAAAVRAPITRTQGEESEPPIAPQKEASDFLLVLRDRLATNLHYNCTLADDT